MSKHTPGPWLVDLESSRAGDICPQNEFDLSICEIQRVDCSAETGRYFDGETTEANRRLIAAAPELLAELKNLHRAYVNLLESGRDRIVALGGDCDPVDRMEQDDPHLRAAKAAIAKATA